MNKFKKAITIGILIGATLISTHTAFGSEFIYGDVNEDKQVTSDDYAYLRMHVNKELILVERKVSYFGFRRIIRYHETFQLTSEYSLKAADVNADGLIDATDVAVLRGYILGMSQSLPSNIYLPYWELFPKQAPLKLLF